MRRLTALILLLAISLVCVPALVNAEQTYAETIAAKLGQQNAIEAFRVTMSHTLEGRRVTVKVVADNFKTEDQVAMLMMSLHFDQETMVNVTPELSNGAIDCVSGLPDTKHWENMVIIDGETGAITLAVVNAEDETCLCTESTRIEFTLLFDLTDDAYAGAYWMPHAESLGSRWDMSEICGNGGYGVFHTADAPDSYHTFTKKITDSAHLAENATCKHGTLYYYTCEECGKIGTETFAVGNPLPHSGGTATCKDLAVCEQCGETYGSKDPYNHVGGTELVNAVEPTRHQPGYSGDTVCLGCGQVIQSGKTLPPTLGELTDDPAFTLTASHTVIGDEVTLTLKVKGFKDVDLISALFIDVHYDNNTMTHVTEKNTDGSYNCVSGLPTSNWENLSADSEDGTFVSLAVMNNASEGECLKSGDTVVFTLKFQMKSGKYEGIYWITNEGAQATEWDNTDRLGNGASGSFHTVSAPETVHTFTVKTADDSHLCNKADCTHPATYFYSCAECGANGPTTFEKGTALGHTGGTATCAHGPICTRCQEEYGELDPQNHEGETEIVGLIKPTYTSHGFTGDTVCAACRAVLKAGEDTPTLGDPTGDNTLNAKDYMYVKRVVLKTRDSSPIIILVSDMNGDGVIDVRDYMIMKRIVLGTKKK